MAVQHQFSSSEVPNAVFDIDESEWTCEIVLAAPERQTLLEVVESKVDKGRNIAEVPDDGEIDTRELKRRWRGEPSAEDPW